MPVEGAAKLPPDVMCPDPVVASYFAGRAEHETCTTHSTVGRHIGACQGLLPALGIRIRGIAVRQSGIQPALPVFVRLGRRKAADRTKLLFHGFSSKRHKRIRDRYPPHTRHSPIHLPGERQIKDRYADLSRANVADFGEMHKCSNRAWAAAKTGCCAQCGPHQERLPGHLLPRAHNTKSDPHAIGAQGSPLGSLFGNCPRWGFV